MNPKPPVNTAAQQLVKAPKPEPNTAAEKILATLRQLADPEEDAGGLELAFGSMAMMLSSALPEALEQMQEQGELDDVILALTRWFSTHRGDDATRLVVVELPRRRDLPAGTKLHCLERAEAVEIPERLPL